MASTLFDHACLDSSHDADFFDRLRLGHYNNTFTAGSGRSKVCSICGSHEHGMGHLLASCSGLRYDRKRFLMAADGYWLGKLHAALQGDWPTAVLFPHTGIKGLKAAVEFGAAIVAQTENKKKKTCMLILNSA